jgi:hypothetical protein
MLFILYYIVAIVVLVMHFTGCWPATIWNGWCWC